MDEEEVQVGVGGLDLDIGMKLSMSGIPYEGELFVRQHSPHYDSCTAVETQLSLLFQCGLTAHGYHGCLHEEPCQGGREGG